MDGIQPFSAGPTRPAGLHSVPAHAPTLAKGPADYFRALRRRIWIVLAIGVPLSLAGAVWTVKQPNVYLAKTQILIEPPQFDPVLSTLVTHDVGRHDPESREKYVPNRIAMIRSKVLADKVVSDLSLGIPSGATGDAAEGLMASVQTRQMPGTNYFTVSLEGSDPARTTKELTLLLEAFTDQAEDEVRRGIEDVKDYAKISMGQLEGELKTLNENVDEMLKLSDTIGPEGKNIKQTQYEVLSSVLLNKHQRLGDLQQQAWLAQSFPSLRSQPSYSPGEVKIAELEELREEYHAKLEMIARRVRSAETDPGARHIAGKLKHIMDRIDRLRAMMPKQQAASAVDPYEALVESLKTEIKADEESAKALLAQVQESMPSHQRFHDLLDKRKVTVERIGGMQTKLWEFEMVSRSRRPPITVLSPPVEPIVPIRPKRALNVAIAIFLSFGLGIGLVVVLEHLDHTVKVPEHLTAGLNLPLFGVIPRIRRTASIHRGGHLWTPGAPDSIEADAYRNLRASLLGVSDRRGAIVKLLVTSAKAGEGKSTTALNLAATCARAGERTLLMDVDLRRPSLADVFHDEEDAAHGLVDVLRGDLPWQRTVVRTDIPNLDFLPTGDTRDVPIEVLGTRELRQLLIGLSNHYDRIILDGPAILGLADCRMLGRVVDASLLVVRSGTQELRPLQHAKAMLEQSHVVIAGVVFNGLYEDLKNWSSYGPDTPYGYTDGSGSTRRSAASSGLEGPADSRGALPLAEAVAVG